MSRPGLFGGFRAKTSPKAAYGNGGADPVGALLARYQRADAFGRLCLWAQHRDLRHEFDEMGIFGEAENFSRIQNS